MAARHPVYEQSLQYDPTLPLEEFITLFELWCIRNHQTTPQQKAASFVGAFPLGCQTLLNKIYVENATSRNLWSTMQEQSKPLILEWYGQADGEDAAARFEHTNTYMKEEPFAQFQSRFLTALAAYEEARSRSGRGELTQRDKIDALELRVTPVYRQKLLTHSSRIETLEAAFKVCKDYERGHRRATAIARIAAARAFDPHAAAVTMWDASARQMVAVDTRGGHTPLVAPPSSFTNLRTSSNAVHPPVSQASQARVEDIINATLPVWERKIQESVGRALEQRLPPRSDNETPGVPAARAQVRGREQDAQDRQQGDDNPRSAQRRRVSFQEPEKKEEPASGNRQNPGQAQNSWDSGNVQDPDRTQEYHGHGGYGHGGYDHGGYGYGQGYYGHGHGYQGYGHSSYGHGYGRGRGRGRGGSGNYRGRGSGNFGGHGGYNRGGRGNRYNRDEWYSSQPCYLYQRGNCYYGNRCKFNHEGHERRGSQNEADQRRERKEQEDFIRAAVASAVRSELPRAMNSERGPAASSNGRGPVVHPDRAQNAGSVSREEVLN